MKKANLIIIDETDSTNNYARGLVLSKPVDDWTVVLAHHQTKGRGHQKNEWESEKNKNLTFTLILKPQFLEPSKQFFLSEIVCLGIQKYLSSIVDNVKIKWPNDIYLGGRKIGGILIENDIAGNHISTSYVGIGLNINQEIFLSNAPNPISLKNIIGKEFNLLDVLNQVIDNILYYYQKLRNGENKLITNNYHSGLFRKGERRDYLADGKKFKGTILGVDEFGRLIINTESGNRVFQFKEVEYLV